MVTTKTRYSVFKNGRTTKTGVTLQPLYISSGKTKETTIKKSKITNLVKQDYFIVKEEFNGAYWAIIKGSEEPLT